MPGLVSSLSVITLDAILRLIAADRESYALLPGQQGSWRSRPQGCHWCVPIVIKATHFIDADSCVQITPCPMHLSTTRSHITLHDITFKMPTEPAEKVSETVKAAVGGASAEASQKAGELKEDAKGAATNAGYSAEQVKAEATKKANNGEAKITYVL